MRIKIKGRVTINRDKSEIELEKDEQNKYLKIYGKHLIILIVIMQLNIQKVFHI